ncbi:MAG: 30S ribosomal protein S20 [Candidatus Magasanikbacteria bacterium]|nr:30S ribosomal protein S20 [Candidatus Magasanikbacteria bacterium]
MPLIKSAIKKMRQDKARTLRNRAKIDALKKAIKLATLKPSTENLSKAFSNLDKAAKKGLIPKSRANRKKSRLSKKVIVSVTPKSPKVKSTSPKKKKSS